LKEKVQAMTSDYQSDVRSKQARHEQQILGKLNLFENVMACIILFLLLLFTT